MEDVLNELVVDCKTVGFFLKIGKAWHKSLTRAKRASLTPEAREKRPTVRFSYNEFVPTRGFKNVVELSKICSQLRPLYEFEFYISISTRRKDSFSRAHFETSKLVLYFGFI